MSYGGPWAGDAAPWPERAGPPPYGAAPPPWVQGATPVPVGRPASLPPPPAGRPPRFGRKPWLIVGALAVLGLVGVGAVVLAVRDDVDAGADPSGAGSTGSAASTTPPPTVLIAGRVVDVLDGSTVLVDREIGPDLTVRVAGIDSPDLGEAGEPAECWSRESAAFASRNLLDTGVTVLADPTRGDLDGAGEIRAQVMLSDGRNFAVVAVRNGAVRVDVADPAPQAAGLIRASEGTARSERRGLWGPPCSGRTTSEAPATSTGTTSTATTGPPPPSGAPPTTVSSSPPATTTSPPPPADPGLDPRFGSCADANTAGYGNYRRGVDPEYTWYDDRDGDGIVCEF